LVAETGRTTLTRPLLGFTLGIVLILVGSALVANYRDVATRHVRLSFRWSPRWGTRGRPEPDTIAFFVMFDRVFGGFAVASGIVTLVFSAQLVLAH
jgi:uncharacterized membrane protein YphA (DoxX/SURF4 family)